jgi:hypothetical protein
MSIGGHVGFQDILEYCPVADMHPFKPSFLDNLYIIEDFLMTEIERIINSFYLDDDEYDIQEIAKAIEQYVSDKCNEVRIYHSKINDEDVIKARLSEEEVALIVRQHLLGSLNHQLRMVDDGEISQGRLRQNIGEDIAKSVISAELKKGLE